MEPLVITAVGNDRAGLVETLSGIVARHGGNWEQSKMAELAGTFAGVVLVSVPEAKSLELRHDLEDLTASGLLNLMVEVPGHSAVGESAGVQSYRLELVGQDHPGIVHEVSHTLAQANVSIDELETEVVPAPMGGHLFKAEATIEVPANVDIDDLRSDLEALAADLMVDLDLTPEA